MTTELAKGSRDQFVDRTISPPIEKIAQTESAERLRGRSPIADTAKEAPSDRIRPGTFAKADISGLRFGYAAPGGPSAPVPRAPSPAGSKDPVIENIFAEAKSQSDPALALQVLDYRYEAAPDAVKKKLLSDPRARDIVATVANDVNKAFTAEPKNPAHAAGLAIRSIVRILTTYDLKPTMAGALLDQTFKGHAEAFSAVQSGASSPAASPELAREGQELMAQLLRFTAKTPQGKQAAASLTAFSENQTNRLVGALRGSLPQGANTAFELLVKNKKFTRLEPQTRFALLSQINNYRDNNRITEVIENLGRLARQPWFVGSLLAHQQLSAQIVAFDSQYDGSKNIRYKLEPILQGDGKKILRHTLDLILDERGNTKLVWTNLGPVVSGTGDDSTNQVELNYNLMQPGNVKLAGERPIDVATDTLPHEANHVVNHISRTPVGSCLRMIHELYAAGVGYEATTYNKLNEQAAYNYIRNNFFSGKPPYTDLAAIIWYNGNDKSKEAESAKIARVIATMLGKDPKSGEYRIGKDPSQATNRDIILFDRKFEKNPDILSKSEPALIPKDIDGAPLNLSLDNRVGP